MESQGHQWTKAGKATWRCHHCDSLVFQNNTPPPELLIKKYRSSFRSDNSDFMDETIVEMTCEDMQAFRVMAA